jgi:hypothetical protein
VVDVGSTNAGSPDSHDAAIRAVKMATLKRMAPRIDTTLRSQSLKKPPNYLHNLSRV